MNGVGSSDHRMRYYVVLWSSDDHLHPALPEAAAGNEAAPPAEAKQQQPPSQDQQQ